MFPTTFLLVLDIPRPTRDINRYSVPDMFLTCSRQRFFLFWISHAQHVTLVSIAFLTCSRQAPDTSHALHVTLPDPDEVPLKVTPVRQDNTRGNHRGTSGLRASGGPALLQLEGIADYF